jgi:hypothetical protein
MRLEEQEVRPTKVRGVLNGNNNENVKSCAGVN